MTTHTDRAALERAINAAKPYHMMYGTGAFLDRMKIIIAAAEAHLETLPKTKMVEVWRVEWAVEEEPYAQHYKTGREADAAAEAIRSIAVCVKVSGPHLQEVPV